MSITVKHAGEYPVSCWAGGKTTELYLYPQDAEYAKRNFIFRLSSATVDCEKSTFTALPGVHRLIMPLQGEMHLSFEGHGEKTLQPFEQTSFDGGWNTVSVGKATDFNLMLRQGAQGSMEVLSLAAQESKTICGHENEFTAVYIAQGSCGGSFQLDTASLLMMQGREQILLENNRGEACRLICTRIKLA